MAKSCGSSLVPCCAICGLSSRCSTKVCSRPKSAASVPNRRCSWSTTTFAPPSTRWRSWSSSTTPTSPPSSAASTSSAIWTPSRWAMVRCGDSRAQLNELLGKASDAARQLDSEVILSGILPTLEKSDLTLENMDPQCPVFRPQRGHESDAGRDVSPLHQGRHELNITHDNVMLEACNTSFQVHFPGQARELRPPLQHRADRGSTGGGCGGQLASAFRPTTLARNPDRSLSAIGGHPFAGGGTCGSYPSRVSFGRGWIKESVAEIFKEDISRFRVLLSTDVREDPFEALATGKAPKLAALCLHNGTIYRWNRPCYGVSADGTAHLRIENRVLPSGPSPVDEIANAALWFGLLNGLDNFYGDVTKVMDFDTTRENFVAACRRGMTAHFNWPEREDVSAQDLLLDELLPLAREGLKGLDIEFLRHRSLPGGHRGEGQKPAHRCSMVGGLLHRYERGGQSIRVSERPGRRHTQPSANR